MTTDSRPVLWIGRMLFSDVVRIREVELLQHVAARRSVFALDRSDTVHWGRAGVTSSLLLRWELATGGWKTLGSDHFTRFRMPVTMATGPILNRVAARLNEARIRQAIDRFGCRLVFHSSPTFFLPPERGRRPYACHFDLVDNYFDGYPETMVGRSRREFLRESMRNADTLSTISHRLCDRVEEFAGRRPAYVPNGVALKEIRAWPAERAAAARRRLGISERRALVYVGNHMASFDGMEMLLDAFVAARGTRNDLALVLVGPGADRVTRARGLGLEHGIHVVGPVPATEVWDYFHAADLGLLPFVVEPGTHDCLPLKVLEFGGAGKPMLATPLAELQRIALPHVRYAPYDAAAWRRALVDEKTYAAPHPGELERAMRPFSWESAAERLMEAMGIGSTG